MSLSFYGKHVTKQEYKQITNSVLPLLMEVSEYYSCDLTEIDWHRVYSYVCVQLNYDIIFHDFGDVASKYISGRTKKVDGTISIIINNNHTHNRGRQNFTLLHEVFHAYVHIGPFPYSIFALQDRSIEPDNVQPEIEADIGASILIANDIALIDRLQKNYSFSDLCKTFDSSLSGMTMRLRNLLHYNYDMADNLIYSILADYRYKNDKALNQFIRHSREIMIHYNNESDYYEFSQPHNLYEIRKDVNFYTNTNNIMMKRSTKEIICNYVYYNLIQKAN